jgi:hypothetical protein
MLRQQQKNNRGRREAGRSPKPPPPTWKELNHERQEVPRALLGNADGEGASPLNDPQESVDNIIEIPPDSRRPLRP